MDEVAVVGMMVSRRCVAAGERLNLMLIAINAGEHATEREFVVYLQRSDRHGKRWSLADRQIVRCVSGEATHVYFSLDPACMAKAQGRERWIQPCEFLVWGACAKPGEDGSLPPAQGMTDLFCVEGSCRL